LRAVPGIAGMTGLKVEFLRYASSVYGQPVLLGASWSLLPWFFGAGVGFIIVHAAYKAVTGSRGP
jgi:hypothetical protein